MLWALVPATLIVAIVSRHDYNLLGLYLRWHRYCSSTAVSMCVALFCSLPDRRHAILWRQQDADASVCCKPSAHAQRLTRINGCQRPATEAELTRPKPRPRPLSLMGSRLSNWVGCQRLATEAASQLTTKAVPTPTPRAAFPALMGSLLSNWV